VPLGEQVRQLLGGHSEADHEGEVEQQLQWGGGTVRLVGVAAGHANDTMGERLR
jgi:hypothetical protein